MGMIKMYHDDPEMTGGPTTAEVPEEGVPMMRRAGWYLSGEREMTAPENSAGNFIDGMTVAEMREYAKEHGIPIQATATTKAEIAELLKAKEHTPSSM